METGLNPCFNGRCTRTGWYNVHRFGSCVLILVLMEDALALRLTQATRPSCKVLILVLMEDALAQRRW